MTLVLCNRCIRARGGSSAIGKESAVRIIAGVCADCSGAICSCRGRHTMPDCPLMRSPVRVGELRAFRVEGPEQLRPPQ